MPTVLDTPKQATKQEEFVEKQIEQARKRIRTLDFFSAGLILLICSLAFLLAVLLVDRYVERPAGAGWAALGFYLFAAASFVYLTLFRPSRRQINPFYAAHQVEQTIEGAKNSVINYVDLKDDDNIPGSVKASIGARAAKDLKQVDLNRVIQKKQILWLAGVAGIFFVAALVAAFLPPTRTSMMLTEPKEGDITINQGEDFRVEVELKGRIPKKTDSDVARVRMWYNPDDPNSYEERPLEPIEGRKNSFGLTVPAKQLRNGFRYKLLAAKAQTRDFEVKVRIIPQFTGWEVSYAYPEYLKREPEKSGDPNLVGYYNTIVTVTAYTNKPVKSGTVLIAGEVNTFAGTLIADNPETIRFQFPMMRNSTYKIVFATTDGDSNRSRDREPQTYRMSLIDPKPLFLNYDVTYDYPKYLRYKPMSVNVRQPHLEAMRGTKVTLVAHANRPVKSAQIQFPGHDQPIAGIVDDKKPMEVKFAPPAMMEVGSYRITFAPKTSESESAPEVFNVRVLSDEPPKVEIKEPEPLEIKRPANGILEVVGEATDDIGIAEMTLRMKVVSPASTELKPQPYRKGKFLRPEDNSYPTSVKYKDFVELAKVKPDGDVGAGFQLQEGMVVEYWLEAIDNCDVPPGPNKGESTKKRVTILAPMKMMPEQQKKDQENLEKDKKEHEKKQDQKNADEKRDPNQPQPKGDPQDQPEQGERGKEPPRAEQKGDPKVGKKSGMTGMEDMGEKTPPSEDQPMVDPMDEAKVKDALAQANKKKGGTETEPKDKKVDPNDPKPEMKDDPKDMKKEGPKNEDPKLDPNGPKKENPKGEPKKDADKLDPKQLPKPEDFQDLADKLDDPKKKEEGREQLKQLMEQAKKNPEKAEDSQKKAEDFRDKLPKDEQKKFDESLDKIAKEMENIERQEQKDQVKKAAEKAMSNDPKERAEGQKQLEDMMRDPKKQKDVDRELQNLASDQTDGERKQRLDDAMNLSKKNLAKKDRNPNTDPQPPMPPMPKKEEDVDELAKKVQKGTPEEKKEAEDELQKKLKDPDQREKVQQQLDDIKKNIKDEQAKKNFEESMDKIKENLAKKDEPKPTTEDVQKLADKLNSKDEKDRQEARQHLEKSIDKSDKDPKAQEEARKQMQDLRDSIKDEKKKEEFDKAMKQIDQASDEIRQEKQAKAEKQTKEEVGEVAKGLSGKDPVKKDAAEKKLEEMLKDPKKKDAIKNELDKIKEESKDELAKKNIDEAVKKAEAKLAKKKPAPKGGKVDPKDVEKIAKDLNGKDPMKKNDAQQKLEDLLKDPAKKDAVKDELEKIKKGLNDETAKKNIDDAVKKAEEKIAQGGMGDQPKKEDVEKLARDLNSKDQKTKDAAEDKLEEMLKDPNQRGVVKNELDKIKKGLDDETAKKNIDDAIKKAENKIAKGKEGNVKPEDVAKMADKLQNGTPGEKQQAQKQLEEMLKDPKARDQVQKEFDKIKEGLKDQTAKDNLDKAVKQAKDNIAKKGEGEGDSPKVKPEDVEKLVKDLESNDPKTIEKARKELEEIAKDPKKKADFDKQLGEMLKDPEKRKQIQEAIEQPVKNELKKIADKLKNGTPEEKKQVRQKLEEIMKNPLDGEVLKQNVDEYAKDIKDPQARKELEDLVKEIAKGLQAKKDIESKDPGKKVDLTKHDPKKSGNQTTDPEKEGPLAELKNKVKAGELVLDEFKKNISNEEFKKNLGWTDEQMAAFRKRYEQQLAALQKQLELAEKGELPLPRIVGPSPIGKEGPERINLDPKESGNPLQGGRTIAPPGFGDPYKRFAEEVSGVRTPAPPAAKK